MAIFQRLDAVERLLLLSMLSVVLPETFAGNTLVERNIQLEPKIHLAVIMAELKETAIGKKSTRQCTKLKLAQEKEES